MILAEAHAALDSLILTSRKDRGEAVLARIAEALEYICSIERKIESPARELKAVEASTNAGGRAFGLALAPFGIDLRFTPREFGGFEVMDQSAGKPLGIFSTVEEAKQAVNWPAWTANGWERKA